ncbi:hypothetical protein [Ensifer aridi]|uniref:hypothetical protein n=1 Tax=Ensifer aridi TaxID=1708715 RepID=UPI000A1041C8|nr:hypothetical protein [Ensifer aridi]
MHYPHHETMLIEMETQAAIALAEFTALWNKGGYQLESLSRDVWEDETVPGNSSRPEKGEKWELDQVEFQRVITETDAQWHGGVALSNIIDRLSWAIRDMQASRKHRAERFKMWDRAADAARSRQQAENRSADDAAA